MWSFILKRWGHSLLVLLIVSILVCYLMRLIPGDPILLILGDEFDPETYARMQHDLALDKPIFMQYFYWMANVLRGDFGYSYFTHKDVSTLLAQALPPTLALVTGTLIVGVLIALSSGILAAVHRNTKWDYLSMGFAIVGYSMPSFWKGILLIWGFAVLLGWFPTMGYMPLADNFWKGVWYLILPSLTLGTFFAGLVARMTRSSLLEVLDHEYIKAAKAKGVGEAALDYKHALRNAMIPIVTVIGLQFGELLSGAVLTETVFSIPGMGRLIISSILNREYHVVQAAVLVGVVFFVGVNLIVDVLYGILNPKIRLGA